MPPAWKKWYRYGTRKREEMRKILIILLGVLMISGCNLNEGDENLNIYSTYYPIEFATSYMYKDYSTISSIYPSGADTETYTLTDKQKDIYSNGDLFVYAGVTKEVDLAVRFLNTNSELRIIDATKGLNYNIGVEELWLDPSNYLMIARNIKSTLLDYEKNVYNQNKIQALYDELKIKISELDVDLTMMGKNASRKALLVTDDAFNFLSKYNLEIISLDPNNKNLTKAFNDARKYIAEGKIKYIFTMGNETLSEELENFITSYQIEKLAIDPMYTLTDEQRKENIDYLEIMESNISKFKTELFR